MAQVRGRRPLYSLDIPFCIKRHLLQNVTHTSLTTLEGNRTVTALVCIPRARSVSHLLFAGLTKSQSRRNRTTPPQQQPNHQPCCCLVDTPQQLWLLWWRLLLAVHLLLHNLVSSAFCWSSCSVLLVHFRRHLMVELSFGIPFETEVYWKFHSDSVLCGIWRWYLLYPWTRSGDLVGMVMVTGRLSKSSFILFLLMWKRHALLWSHERIELRKVLPYLVAVAIARSKLERGDEVWVIHPSFLVHEFHLCLWCFIAWRNPRLLFPSRFHTT